ncbi:hypothetical protein KUTeg_016389 [Tegillarca granosa]|uniref:mRNA export factor n=1 Tax=Tegillarca granosa TaxID=220873 RepID=A0ABQ9EKR0_TEGGR|nr:hypothetical protein KUTeg_016389 [Tegillarca granosa]
MVDYLVKMSIFNTSAATIGGATANYNAMKDIEVRCWEVHQSGQTMPKAQQTHAGPVLDCCWSDDGTKVFTASCDKTAKMWDLNSNQAIQVAQHEAPVKSVHWIKAPNYTCIMTGSWDKTLKLYPMAVVGTAGREVVIYQLENRPQEFSRINSPLKFQGRVAIQYVNPTNPKDNFTFKCHRSNGMVNGMQDVYAVNDIAFHPVHGTLATVGSDSRFSFWNKDARTKLKTSEPFDQPLTCCDFNADGNIFGYATSYDWSKGHEGYDTQKKPHIFLRRCYDELQPSSKKS